MATSADAQELKRAWRKWESIWSWGNVVLGGTSVALGAVVAVHTKQAFLPPGWDVATAIAAPVLAFLLTTLKPDTRSKQFQAAARWLERALYLNSTNDPPDQAGPLAKAMAEGVDILNGQEPPH